MVSLESFQHIGHRRVALAEQGEQAEASMIMVNRKPLNFSQGEWEKSGSFPIATRLLLHPPDSSATATGWARRCPNSVACSTPI